jgi:hypothetical protein
MSGSQQLVLGEGAGGSGVANYIEDVFSTYLYTGNGSTQTITNGIDLSTKGGLVWIKNRNIGEFHRLYYANNTSLCSNSVAGQQTIPDRLSFASNGFNLLSQSWQYEINYSGQNYASWTFRKQAKFFDVVTYTGNDASTRSIPHSLGSVPGCVMIKALGSDPGRSNGYWIINHRSLPSGQSMLLPDTSGAQTLGGYPSPFADSTTFAVTFGSSNTNGVQYVAYLFAHDAGGFGLTGTDNVISCGSYTGNGSTSGPTITLGYEPQWVLIKESSAAGNQWVLFDNMRGMPVGSNDNYLFPNLSNGESSAYDLITPTATGFSLAQSLGIVNASGSTYIYIAIRRGPMKTPTTGTSVFTPIATSAAAGTVLTTGFPLDTTMYALRNTAWSYNSTISSRLTGIPTTSSGTDAQRLQTSATDAEQTLVSSPYRIDNTGFTINPSFGGGIPVIYWNFRRAPGFFDVVCYTGTGANRTVTHNLGVAPELYIFKTRSNTNDWAVYGPYSGATKGFARLNTTAAYSTTVTPNGTSTTFDLGTSTLVNESAYTYVAYLFASCPGVSKVGSYTGTGTTLQIDCGFTGGARFVLIKRTDSTGDWYVWDSARGIVSGNDPYLLLNSTAAEVTSTDYVDTYSAGFEISSTAPAAINANGGTFIFLAIS